MRRSADILSGIVMITRYPFAAAIAASPMPVLPLVGSTMTEPLLRTPRRSASSIISFATRSFTEPAGFIPSSFARIRAFAPIFSPKRDSSNRGVRPTNSATD